MWRKYNMMNWCATLKYCTSSYFVKLVYLNSNKDEFQQQYKSQTLNDQVIKQTDRSHLGMGAVRKQHYHN